MLTPISDSLFTMVTGEAQPQVSFSSCQRNLLNTFQIEAMIALITKIDLIFS